MERPDDIDAIHQLHCAAFGTGAEASLVNALREQARPLISLVAEDGDVILGHILFSPVTLLSRPELRMMGLAPMAVDPAHQQKGIGSALVRAGLETCRELGFEAVVVLGHAQYYPKFGFGPASRFGLTSEYEVPDEAFMAVELQPGALRGSRGTIRYHPAFPTP